MGARHRIRSLIDVMRKHLKGGGRLGWLTETEGKAIRRGFHNYARLKDAKKGA